MKKFRKTRANQLDKFIEDRHLPDKDFRTQVNEAIHIICSFVKERCFRWAPDPVRVSKVVKVSPELPGWGEGVWSMRNVLYTKARETHFSDCFSSTQCKEKLRKPLPPQYALELLTVYAWEQGSMETRFNTAQGFQTVLELVLKHQHLCIYWEKYYDFENPMTGQYLRRQLAKPRPVILDPADPTGNVAGGDPCRWQRLAQEARAWLSYPCLKNWDGSPVGSWDVSPQDHSDLTYEACGFRQSYRTSPRLTFQGGAPPQVEENWTCAIL
ncbi:2'-5'-oligoadenylate synthase 1 [Sagmatias obliquidens]|uniref:2'-5'-oligoadenylate synthase 1 n=1 Tax=Sagmatias obliquidens TaxID=3371155 RepID=UPI000F4435E7|nr:2'-5'-oligoadenylate synthase 1 [Lagenorhynchus obliquidens]